MPSEKKRVPNGGAVALPAALALVCTTVPTAYASGDDHAWEYVFGFGGASFHFDIHDPDVWRHVPTAYASGDDHAWEYEAAFDIQESADTYSLNMANNADATMKFCFHLTDTHDAHGVHEVEDNCHADEASPTNVTANAPAITIVSGTTYQVIMDPDSWLSVFNVKFPANGAYAFFAEHMPSEFHFTGGTEMELLKDGDSHDVTAAWASTDVAPASRKTPWGNTMLGCLFVWVVTLSGLVLIINTKVWELVKPYALMFASGTLLSTAFALVLYESTHLIPIGNNEGLAAGRWTAMILCGFITSPVIAIVLKFFLPQLENDDEFSEPVKPGNTMIGEGNAQKALDSAEMGRAIDNCSTTNIPWSKVARRASPTPTSARVPHVPHRGRLLP